MLALGMLALNFIDQSMLNPTMRSCSTSALPRTNDSAWFAGKHPSPAVQLEFANRPSEGLAISSLI
ncbi:MAG: hypothetical protein EAZ21_05375 [Betaproteobacteria bacterium]|nr:MAG: hypothetical protein EAZ21_05375 [Betaproteobacteria bacterium]